MGFRVIQSLLTFILFLSTSAAFAVDLNPDFIEKYKKELVLIQTEVGLDKLEKAFEMVKSYPTKEAYEAVVRRIERLPDRKNLLDKNSKIKVEETITVLIRLMNLMGTYRDLPLLVDFAKWAHWAVNSQETDERILKTVLHLKDTAHNNKLRNLSKRGTLSVSSEKLSDDHKTALLQVDHFFDRMSKEVVGQDEVLKSMRELYLKDLLTGGDRKAPELFYLMGLPGNGKDTIVEAYVDALHNRAGAHNDHMFRMNIRNKAEAWTYFGSAKGYIGSNEMPSLLKFLVEHSGGRYQLGTEKDSQGKDRVVVNQNPEWKSEKGLLLSGGADKAVIFVNEAHNIPKSIKDNVLKQVMEKGIFTINNPGQGPNAVTTMEVPVTFVFATNEGISLLEPREKNGARLGKPLTYERLMENYDLVSRDKPTLRQAVLGANGEKNNPVGDESPGTSEEWLNRIPDHRLHILKPLSPESLINIAKIVADRQSLDLSNSKGSLGSYDVQISNELIEFVTTYDYIPSENARPIKGRVESFIFDQIYAGLQSQKIKALGSKQEISIDLHKYENGAVSVVFNLKVKGSGETYSFRRLISQTLKDVPPRALSNQRVEEIVAMRQEILDNVFGVEHIVDELIKSALVSESASKNSGDSKRPATVLAFLGKSSTGKTETAKQYVKARYGDSEKPVIIDFNGVRSLEALEAKILGSVDARKNAISSDFMKAYDRAKDGNIAFIFDEAANAPKELLKGLYELLRESVATGFSDGKPRSMKNVTIVLTGNAGEQIYNAIPNDLPTDVHERALNEVFRVFMNNESLQQRILKENFSEAFLARLGRNIYHFGPLQYSSKRQIAQLKLSQGLESLKPKPSERGWDIAFASEQDLLNLFGMIEKDGFDHAYQGASIDRFVRDAVIDRIKSTLLIEKVANGVEVVIEVLEKPVLKTEHDAVYVSRQIKLVTASGKEMLVEIPVGQKHDNIEKRDLDRVLTAYHEAGHEIVSEVYFGDRVRPKFLSIIEGVSLIGDQFVHYAGLRSGEYIEDSRYTKEVVLRNVAILTGGYVAQQLVTLGARDDAGKSNDMHRATKMVQESILRNGLSHEWGKAAVPSGMKIEDYISNLSEHDQSLLREITDRWLLEGEKLAREALLVNADRLFLRMGQEIAEKGYLNKDDILKLYDDNGVLTERSGFEFDEAVKSINDVLKVVDSGIKKSGESFYKDFTAKDFSLDRAAEAYNFLARRARGIFGVLNFNGWNKLSELQKVVAGSYISGKVTDKSRDAQIADEFWLPKSVANITRIIEKEKALATAPVTDTSKFKISAVAGSMMCGKFL
jgi:ATP-dependent Clp protease ATP-binding subunit ClpA